MNIQTTVVFEELIKSEELQKRIVVAQGGARSGKTFNILIWWIQKLLQEDKKLASGAPAASAPKVAALVLFKKSLLFH